MLTRLDCEMNSAKASLPSLTRSLSRNVNPGLSEDRAIGSGSSSSLKEARNGTPGSGSKSILHSGRANCSRHSCNKSCCVAMRHRSPSGVRSQHSVPGRMKAQMADVFAIRQLTNLPPLAAIQDKKIHACWLCGDRIANIRIEHTFAVPITHVLYERLQSRNPEARDFSLGHHPSG